MDFREAQRGTDTKTTRLIAHIERRRISTIDTYDNEKILMRKDDGVNEDKKGAPTNTKRERKFE